MPDRPSRERPGHGDRRAILLVAGLVAVVLVASIVSALLPGMDAALASLPLIVLILVLGTVLVLARAVRP